MNIHESLMVFLEDNKIPYEKNVDLKRKTWIHRGGLCDLFISPENRECLVKTILYFYNNSINFLIIGHTSNVYILNTSNIPFVISTRKCRFYDLKNNYIYCDAGVSVIRLANDMIKKGVRGFEYLSDLPGTIGGAIYNNSSCKGNSISELLISADVLLPDGHMISMKAEDFDFGYRTSIFKEKRIKGTIISVILKADFDDAEKLAEIALSNKEERKKLLGVYSKCLGSTVNNCFNEGRMPLFYYLLFRSYNLFLKFAEKNVRKRRQKSKDFICRITGYSKLSEYISNEDIIMFIWQDENADRYFPQYIEFMKKIYRTSIVEIEVI